jgi:hypothetical protein
MNDRLSTRLRGLLADFRWFQLKRWLRHDMERHKLAHGSVVDEQEQRRAEQEQRRWAANQ